MPTLNRLLYFIYIAHLFNLHKSLFLSSSSVASHASILYIFRPKTLTTGWFGGLNFYKYRFCQYRARRCFFSICTNTSSNSVGWNDLFIDTYYQPIINIYYINGHTPVLKLLCIYWKLHNRALFSDVGTKGLYLNMQARNVPLRYVF